MKAGTLFWVAVGGVVLYLIIKEQGVKQGEEKKSERVQIAETIGTTVSDIFGSLFGKKTPQGTSGLTGVMPGLGACAYPTRKWGP
jgi:hypothetical protein